MNKYLMKDQQESHSGQEQHRNPDPGPSTGSDTSSYRGLILLFLAASALIMLIFPVGDSSLEPVSGGMFTLQCFTGCS